jgi:hypothetical protein
MTNGTIGWKSEIDVNDYVKRSFEELGKVKNVDYNEENGMSSFMKEALKGSAKTRAKTSHGVPDLHIEKLKQHGRTIPVIIEDKFSRNKFIKETGSGIPQDDKIIGKYAVNDAIYYARNMIASGKYQEVVAIGCAGDNEYNVRIGTYYVYGSAEETVKPLPQYKTLDFLQNQTTFDEFYKDATLTEEDKQQFLINSDEKLEKCADELNVLMYKCAIGAAERVIYVSGMLIAMQDLKDKDAKLIEFGLTPDDLTGSQIDKEKDGVKVVNRIEEYLRQKDIPESKRNLMLKSFQDISDDEDRDRPTKNKEKVEDLLEDPKNSINKQIFTFIYEHIYKSIDGMSGYVDIMGKMYSNFLKYALGDGKELGKVLTPPYITKMMVEILGVNKDSRVMDLAAGSAGFLISAMQYMIDETEKEYGRETTKAKEKIAKIKRNQLLGVELDKVMFTLASTNMILRGDGSANIKKGDSFDQSIELYSDFNADILLLNPPFSYDENGMPFLKLGLDSMPKGAKAAIIIQDSAGSGVAAKTNKEILKHNQLLASIKMPGDLFEPMATVQTSIYVFERTGQAHDYTNKVRFIDFRNDGYKRTQRKTKNTKILDDPKQRYQDIADIYKNGTSADVSDKLWDLKKVVIDDVITDSGKDWNFEQHFINNKALVENAITIESITPTEEDFKQTIAEFLSWEVSKVLQGMPYSGKA